LLTAPQLRQIHAHLLTSLTHLASARCVFDEACSWTSLLTAYARAGQLNEARSLFDGMPHKTPVAWSAMLSAYVGAGGFADALEVFDGMLRARVRPNRAAFVGALAACGALRALEQGRWVHALVTGSGMDGVVATTLVDMHAKWGSLEAATQVFADMLERERDAFAYTAMNES
jgi:pentatricopeptide repeat protein